MTSYRDSKIYQLSHKLAVELHPVTLKLPKFELYEEGSQIRRSSKAIPANIVKVLDEDDTSRIMLDS